MPVVDRTKKYYVNGSGGLTSVSLNEYKEFAKEIQNGKEQSLCAGQSFVWEQGGRDDEPQGCAHCKEAVGL